MGAVHLSLRRLYQMPSVNLTQLHTISSGNVAVTESRAQRCPPLPVRSCSCHEASPQLLCSGPSTPKDLSCSSHTSPSRTFAFFLALLWTLSHSFMPFLYCSAQKCTSARREAAPEQSKHYEASLYQLHQSWILYIRETCYSMLAVLLLPLRG